MVAWVTARALQFVPEFTARHLPPAGSALLPVLRARGHTVWPLWRRGADLGFVLPLRRQLPDRTAAAARWRSAEAVFLPGIAAARLPASAPHIATALRMFDRLRQGARFLDELELRLRHDDRFVYAGSTVDHGDRREIERVFVDAVVGDRTVAKDLWARLAWIADDHSDVSLRIRHSFGKEQLEDWLSGDDEIAGWSDRFAGSAFPESAVVLGCRPLQQLLARLLGRPFRLSERIVYNNAPGGGAVFHHDAEPGQLGVVFTQLAGHTAWLAISKRRLAALLCRHGAEPTMTAAMLALEADDQRRWRLLNRDAAFTARLAAAGALFVLAPGDAILLPSHGIDDATWHSVFALSTRPSLAHSYGIFPLAAPPPARHLRSRR